MSSIKRPYLRGKQTDMRQLQNYIYWIISTENDHRHHHKFIKYEKRLRKEGNMPRLTYQAQSLLLQREFGRVAHPSVRSNGPTDYDLCSVFFNKKNQNYRYRNYCPWWQEFNLTRLYSYDLLCEPVRFMLLIDNNLLLPVAKLHILNNIYRKWL
jgi:hypothetical protein